MNHDNPKKGRHSEAKNTPHVPADFAERVKLLIAEIEPSVEIFMYGSSVEHSGPKEHSWDFLVLVDGPVTSARADRVRHCLYKTGTQFDGKISVVVKDRREWNDPANKNVPLYKRIKKEGIAL